MSAPGLRTLGPRRILPRARLQAPVVEVAPGLLGALLVRVEEDGSQSVARLAEVEAYRSDDRASHSFAGRTARTDAMFRQAGTAYVYRAYGMHWCLNVACGDEGRGAAVLLRAAVALSNLPLLHRRRGREVDDRGLLRGPGVLARTLAVDDSHYGLDLCDDRGRLRLETDGWRPDAEAVAAGPRVGVRHAHERAWRWYLEGVEEVSAYRAHPRAGE